MYNASHAAPEKRRNPGRKVLLLIVSLVLIAAIAVGGTIAYLKAETDPVVNTFEAGQNGSTIIEEITGTEKTSIIVKNEGTVPAYVRVAVVINNVDTEGNILSSETGPISYDMGNWQYLNGYYYYKGIIPAGGSTQNLLEGNLSFNNKTVDVIAQTVQTAGEFELNGQKVSAPKYAWGVDFDGSKWN